MIQDVFTQLFGVCFLILGSLIWIVALFIVLVGAVGVLRVVIDNVFEVNSIEIARKLQMRGLLDRKREKDESKVV